MKYFGGVACAAEGCGVGCGWVTIVLSECGQVMLIVVMVTLLLLQ